MNLSEQLQSRWAPVIKSVLRIVAGYLFLLHGSSKLLGVPYNSSFENLQLLSLMGAAGTLELVGGLLILLGLLTRPVAFLLSGQMAFAYFMVHAPRGSWLLPLTNNGEPAVLFCFIFLFFAAAGGGAWSLDAVFAGRKSSSLHG